MFEKAERWWDFLSGGCLFLVVYLSVRGLELTNWTEDLDRVTIIAVYGILIGFLIGVSTFKKNFAIFLLWLYFVAVFLLGFVFAMSDDITWMGRINIFLYRLNATGYQFINNIPLDDSILFLSGSVLLFGLLSFYMGFKIVRKRNIWIMFFIITAIFYIVQFYQPLNQRDYFSIFFYSILILVFIGRQSFIHKRAEWLSRKVKEENDTFLRISIPYIVTVVVIVSISLGFPLLHEQLTADDYAGETIINNQQGKTWEYIRNFFNPLRQSRLVRVSTFPEELPLGTERNLSEDVVFSVLIPDLDDPGMRFYWQGRVYQEYQNGDWKNRAVIWLQSEDIELFPYDPNHLTYLPYQFTYEISHQVILTPQITKALSRDAKFQISLSGTTTIDLLSMEGNKIIRPTEKIAVFGSFYWPQLSDLVESGEDDPMWVEEVYLSLPPELSEDIQDLAVSITADKITRLDKVVSITNFLRNEYQYRDSINLPEDTDPLTWFLFEGKQGFCNFYASAEVIMLRSIGIPARIVSGYAQGYKKPGENIFIVRVMDSHTWVEVFFPNVGWIIFEPTPSIPAVKYVNKTTDPENADDLQQGEEIEESWDTQNLGPDGLNRNYDDIILQDFLKDSGENEVFFLNPVFVAVVLGFLLIFWGYYSLFLREHSIRTPILIEQLLTKRESPVPVWIKSWSDYENLSFYERIFWNIRTIAKIFLRRDIEKGETPRQYLVCLLEEISLDRDKSGWFIDHYLRSVFSHLHEPDSKRFKNSYHEIVRLIIRRSVQKNFHSLFRKSS